MDPGNFLLAAMTAAGVAAGPVSDPADLPDSSSRSITPVECSFATSDVSNDGNGTQRERTSERQFDTGSSSRDELDQLDATSPQTIEEIAEDLAAAVAGSDDPDAQRLEAALRAAGFASSSTSQRDGQLIEGRGAESRTESETTTDLDQRLGQSADTRSNDLSTGVSTVNRRDELVDDQQFGRSQRTQDDSDLNRSARDTLDRDTPSSSRSSDGSRVDDARADNAETDDTAIALDDTTCLDSDSSSDTSVGDTSVGDADRLDRTSGSANDDRGGVQRNREEALSGVLAEDGERRTSVSRRDAIVDDDASAERASTDDTSGDASISSVLDRTSDVGSR